MTHIDRVTCNRRQFASNSTPTAGALCATVMLAAAATAGCSSKQPAAPDSQTADAGFSDTAQSYPLGKWRLAREQLENVLLSVSHILILHDQSNGRSISTGSLRPLDWAPDAVVKRPKERARELAERLSQKARTRPASFATLATRYSEDAPTAAKGGSLGLMTADLLPPPFLDAIAVMRVGDVSRVIETSLGFHIIRWNRPPEEKTVSASHITIAYRGTDPFIVRPGRVADRNRDEALQLAEHVAELARNEPARFTELVQEFSDHVDAARDGDYGAWSTLNPDGYGRLLEIVSELPVGAISDPVDNWTGVEIFKRTQRTDRQQYAGAEIRIPINRFAEDVEAERAQSKALAERLVNQIKEKPERFLEFQREYCCEDILYWSEGRGFVGLNPAVDALRVGEISPEPIETTHFFHIIRRLDPTQLPKPARPVRFSLPQPERPDIEFILENADGKGLAEAVDTLKVRLKRTLQLPPARAQQLSEILDQAAQLYQSEKPSRFVSIFRETNGELRQALGREAFERYMHEVYLLAEQMLMVD